MSTPWQPHPEDLYCGDDDRNERPLGRNSLKGQSRALRFPNYLLIASLGSKFDFLKYNRRFTS